MAERRFAGEIIFGVHAIQRMFERGIGVAEVSAVLKDGKTIESYPARKPFPVRLVLGRVNSRSIHVAVADDDSSGQTIVITVYEPDPGIWESNFERRKK